MPRKTHLVPPHRDSDERASMRPRPDAAENEGARIYLRDGMPLQ